jgi:hypothetical protein
VKKKKIYIIAAGQAVEEWKKQLLILLFYF